MERSIARVRGARIPGWARELTCRREPRHRRIVERRKTCRWGWERAATTNRRGLREKESRKRQDRRTRSRLRVRLGGRRLQRVEQRQAVTSRPMRAASNRRRLQQVVRGNPQVNQPQVSRLQVRPLQASQPRASQLRARPHRLRVRPVKHRLHHRRVSHRLMKLTEAITGRSCEGASRRGQRHQTKMIRR
jgi:hypothetical protein